MESNQELGTGEVGRLRALGAAEPGSPAFAALAEAHRREGDAAQAERVARAGLRARPQDVAGRVALGLALIDLGRIEEARRELERALAAVPDHAIARSVVAATESAEAAPAELIDALDDGAIERAFELAEVEPEEMHDANRVALRAVRAAEAELDLADETLVRPDSPFVTHTVADLLEQQGHAERAQSLRQTISAREGSAEPGAPAAAGPRASDPQGRLLTALEQWLGNLRRGAS